jgi:hypothetical protein
LREAGLLSHCLLAELLLVELVHHEHRERPPEEPGEAAYERVADASGLDHADADGAEAEADQEGEDQDEVERLRDQMGDVPEDRAGDDERADEHHQPGHRRAPVGAEGLGRVRRRKRSRRAGGCVVAGHMSPRDVKSRLSWSNVNEQPERVQTFPTFL